MVHESNTNKKQKEEKIFCFFVFCLCLFVFVIQEFLRVPEETGVYDPPEVLEPLNGS
jgi:hypothetical protein